MGMLSTSRLVRISVKRLLGLSLLSEIRLDVIQLIMV